MSRGPKGAVAGAALSTALSLMGASVALAQTGAYQGYGDSRGYLNIVPPGQDGVLNAVEALQAQAGTYPPHVIDQLSMYGDLVYNAPGLAENRILEFFKDASFGVKSDDVARTYSPTPGLTIIRDNSFGVPHIFG